MSNNNTNQNNRTNNNRGRNNNYDRKKVNKQPKVNPNEIKAPLYLPADLNENIVNEITEVLTSTKFNKISIPIGVRKCFIDNTVDANDTRVATIGYIRNYNAETCEFTVIVFGNFTNIIKELGSIAIDLQIITYKESLGTITKFNIIPVIYEETEEPVIELED